MDTPEDDAEPPEDAAESPENADEPPETTDETPEDTTGPTDYTAERLEGFDPMEMDLPDDGVDHDPTDMLTSEEGNDAGASSNAPTQDDEMPLTEHIEEMIQRLAVVFVVAAGVAVLAFPLGEELINLLWYSVLPGGDVAKPHLYSPPELLLTQLKVASLVGLVLALPVFVYQTYLFMKPGLYPHERRYYLAAVPTSLVLAFVGLTFAHFVVLPAVFVYFLEYTEQVTRIAFALGRTFNLILVLMGFLAVVFQIPLFVMLAMMMGLVTRQWLIQRRLIAWGLFAGLSFIFSPDPTGMSPIIIAITMIVLFEGTLFLSQWTEAGQRQY